MLTVTKNDETRLQNNIYGAANEMGQKMRGVADHAMHDARNAAAVTEKQIRRHPVTASAIAAGIGFILGTLFRRG